MRENTSGLWIQPLRRLGRRAKDQAILNLRKENSLIGFRSSLFGFISADSSLRVRLYVTLHNIKT
jgi:hypothetical protein